MITKEEITGMFTCHERECQCDALYCKVKQEMEEMIEEYKNQDEEEIKATRIKSIDISWKEIKKGNVTLTHHSSSSNIKLTVIDDDNREVHEAWLTYPDLQHLYFLLDYNTI